MTNEIYWKKALKQTEFAIKKNCLFPLSTVDITNEIYDSSDFIIRKLDTNFYKKRIFGPKANPFKPWDKYLEIDQIGKHHQLILNKYPVQMGHILLITKNWKPQNGWLDMDDWSAIKRVNTDTSGLWFFNSCSKAGASQPHRHMQLLRRNSNEKSCPREHFFIDFINSKKNQNKLSKNIIVDSIDINKSAEYLYQRYLELTSEIGLGNPQIDNHPKRAYNILLTNKWLAIVRRSKDNVHGFSVNSLGFAGYLLVTKNSDKEYLKRNGPVKLLENFV